jgi:hypothetical protein
VNESGGAALEAELDALRARLLVAVEAKLAQKGPATLFHYSGASTLQRILESGFIWATEGRFMNDSVELRHAAHLAIEYLADRRGQPDWLLPYLMRAIERDAENRATLMFVASFSRAADSLSQWRAYADDGRGVAIGFDLTHLSDQGDSLGTEFAGPTVDRCIYNPKLQREIVSDCLPEQLAAGIRFVAQGGDQKTARVEVARSLLVSVGVLGCVLKQSGFREEREWRILVMGKKGLQASSLGFRDSKYGPAPYVKVPIRDAAPDHASSARTTHRQGSRTHRPPNS